MMSMLLFLFIVHNYEQKKYLLVYIIKVSEALMRWKLYCVVKITQMRALTTFIIIIIEKRVDVSIEDDR
jgi:hypothetical protein